MMESFIAIIGSYITLKIAKKTLLITSVVTSGAIIAGVFLAAMQALFAEIQPSLHPMVLKGLLLAPSSTQTYVSICIGAIGSRWLYDRQWWVVKWILGGPR